MKYLVFTTLVLLGCFAQAQRLKAVESNIRFFSEAPLENIAAVNTECSSIMDLETGNIVFSLPINRFEFEKSLMQEHFNENYLESDRYPKAILSGKMNTTDLQEGENEVTISGEMDLHGVKQDISVTGTMTKSGDDIEAEAVFMILLEDYDIDIPRAVFYNIAEEIEVTVKFSYEPL